MERGKQDLRHDRQSPHRAGPCTGPGPGPEGKGRRLCHRRDPVFSPVPRRRHGKSHRRCHRHPCPVRAAPAGAVLRPLRGHTPQRREVPHLQDLLCRPLRRRREHAAAGPAHLQPAGRTAGPAGQDLPVGGPQRHRPGGGILFPRHDQRRIRPGRHPQLRAGGVSF